MSNQFVIRKAQQQEWESLADLHFRAYYNRFFDKAARDRKGNLYGAPLAREFPVLAEGQSMEYFRRYWKNFSGGFSDPDLRQRNYCLVADDGGLAAFIKGSGGPIEGQMREKFNKAALGNPDTCCELGSIYCDPDEKYRGAGRQLVAAFARDMLALGYESMVTEAYDKNDSPAFFERLGAKSMGACKIPNDYLTPEGKTETVDIPGVWLYWDKKAMESMLSV